MEELYSVRVESDGGLSAVYTVVMGIWPVTVESNGYMHRLAFFDRDAAEDLAAALNLGRSLRQNQKPGEGGR